MTSTEIRAGDGPERAEAFARRAYRAAGWSEDGVRHSLQVADLLAQHNAPAELVVAGLLHDVVEDTGADLADLRGRFGDRVAELVEALTEDPSIHDYVERKAALRDAVAAAGEPALLVSAADKLARLRTADAAGATVPPHQLDHYARVLELLLARDSESPHLHELAERLRPRRAAAARDGFSR